MEPLYAWVLVLMTTLLPAEKGAAVPTSPDNRETAPERAERYAQIAAAIADVAFDPDEAPVFAGEAARARTAALLVAISYWESGGWNKVVDFGLGPSGRGDGGTSHCLAQVRLSPGARTRHGYGASDLTRDRRACFRAALTLARESFARCGRVPLERRLAVYASGRCDAGVRESARRVHTAERLMRDVPLPARAPSALP